jgi:hypothetical protein
VTPAGSATPTTFDDTGGLDTDRIEDIGGIAAADDVR